MLNFKTNLLKMLTLSTPWRCLRRVATHPCLSTLEAEVSRCHTSGSNRVHRARARAPGLHLANERARWGCGIWRALLALGLPLARLSLSQSCTAVRGSCHPFTFSCPLTHHQLSSQEVFYKSDLLIICFKENLIENHQRWYFISPFPGLLICLTLLSNKLCYTYLSCSSSVFSLRRI